MWRLVKYLLFIFTTRYKQIIKAIIAVVQLLCHKSKITDRPKYNSPEPKFNNVLKKEASRIKTGDCVLSIETSEAPIKSFLIPILEDPFSLGSWFNKIHI